MKAWIVLIDPFRISLFYVSSATKELTFSTIIKNTKSPHSLAETKQISDDFASYVAEEIEIACGCGTNNALIISGDSSDVKKVCKCLSRSIKNSIIGITPKGYNPELWREVLAYAEHTSLVS